MFEVGWSEMLVIAIVMIVVVGPKDLPKMLRTVGKMTSKMRSMAGDFQRQFNEALKEAELDDVKKSVDELRSLNPANQIRKHINPFEQAANEIRSGINNLKPQEPDVPSPVVHPAEPLQNGSGMGSDSALPAVPATPVDPAPASPAQPMVAPAAMTATAGTKAAVSKPRRTSVKNATARATPVQDAKPVKAARSSVVKAEKPVASVSRNAAPAKAVKPAKTTAPAAEVPAAKPVRAKAAAKAQVAAAMAEPKAEAKPKTTRKTPAKTAEPEDKPGKA